MTLFRKLEIPRPLVDTDRLCRVAYLISAFMLGVAFGLTH